MPDPNLVLAVVVLAAGTYLLRLGGVGFGGSHHAVRLRPGSDAAVITLLAGVAATATFYEGQEFAGWARLTGVAAATGLAAVRAPLVVVVVAAAGVTAGLRALGVD
ncbi:AzlD domain-containing protein [Herbiconiux sp. CPCC 203407]|uniref:AzlD domain-containing protein n=1 Tax=Herbiconiux oxytropis TaxID=2970915 RepID=A0AA41XK04_9MICO|nr:AzlD domain-containing protein [Herbiconiux oxytropis]MCS5723939.1 AzlD domain-containing protein [Herbiconiux oxytropis]MCS5728055.1 AzlD domain-containing protein [Herbiconiux oxytropis]